VMGAMSVGGRFEVAAWRALGASAGELEHTEHSRQVTRVKQCEQGGQESSRGEGRGNPGTRGTMGERRDKNTKVCTDAAGRQSKKKFRPCGPVPGRTWPGLRASQRRNWPSRAGLRANQGVAMDLHDANDGVDAAASCFILWIYGHRTDPRRADSSMTRTWFIQLVGQTTFRFSCLWWHLTGI
jgi:hypothetical protein